jgi:hypothetical protein
MAKEQRSYLSGVLEGAKVGEELLQRRELLRFDEVEQSPQLRRVVLQGRAREEDLVVHFDVLQRRQRLRLVALQALRLVHDQHLRAHTFRRFPLPPPRSIPGKDKRRTFQGKVAISPASSVRSIS